MTPAGPAAVCAEVAGRHRRRIVECASGFSTLVLARLRHTRGGRLDSLEHDQTWARAVLEMTWPSAASWSRAAWV
jgi:hypothetical protein